MQAAAAAARTIVRAEIRARPCYSSKRVHLKVARIRPLLAAVAVVVRTVAAAGAFLLLFPTFLKGAT